MIQLVKKRLISNLNTYWVYDVITNDGISYNWVISEIVQLRKTLEKILPEVTGYTDNNAVMNRIDVYQPGKKMNVVFSLNIDSDGYYSIADLKDLRNKIDTAILMEKDLRQLDQSTVIRESELTTSLHRSVTSTGLQFDYVQVSSPKGCFYLNSKKEMLTLISFLKIAQERRAR